MHKSKSHFGRTGGTALQTQAFHVNWNAAKKNARRGRMGNLLHYAIVFLIVALVAAALGFGGVAGTAMAGARLIFWVAIVLFVVAVVANFLRRA
jgi:uncharacterized membrane protein YtjA (UPF0391 family)